MKMHSIISHEYCRFVVILFCVCDGGNGRLSNFVIVTTVVVVVVVLSW